MCRTLVFTSNVKFSSREIRTMCRMRICIACCAGLLLFVQAGIANAATMTWDAVTDYSGATNTAANTWRSFSGAQAIVGGYGDRGTNTNNVLLPVHNTTSTTDSWSYSAGGGVPTVGTDTSVSGMLALDVDSPNDHSCAVIGWKSPITGTVTATFSLTRLDTSNPGSEGEGFALFKDTSTTPLTSAYAGWSYTQTGNITVPNIAVTAGTMLYLDVDCGYWNSNDRTGVTFSVFERRSHRPWPSWLLA